MLDLINENDTYYFIIGFNHKLNLPLHKLEVTPHELKAIASDFTEDLAEKVGEGEASTWECGAFKLTDAPDHPHAWTDSRERTILHYHDLKWHMIPAEIDLLGKKAKELIHA